MGVILMRTALLVLCDSGSPVVRTRDAIILASQRTSMYFDLARSVSS